MGGRGRASFAGTGGGKGPKGGGGGSSSKGKVTFTAKELQKHIDEQIKALPENVRKTLNDKGVKTKVVHKETLVAIFGEKAKSWRGLYHHATKTAFVVLEQFQYKHGGRNAGMTALHELGHAFDAIKGGVAEVSLGKKFAAAVKKDQKGFSGLKLTSLQNSALRYFHYAEKDRNPEIFAEGVAVAFGKGRPKPATDWNDSDLFRQAYPNVIKFIKKALK